MNLRQFLPPFSGLLAAGFLFNLVEAIDALVIVLILISCAAALTITSVWRLHLRLPFASAVISGVVAVCAGYVVAGLVLVITG